MRPDLAWRRFEPTDENPWSVSLASHLFRRAGFGASMKEIDSAVTGGMDSTIDGLFDLQRGEEMEREMANSARVLTGGQDSRGLSALWLLRMLQTPCPLQEKMTLFLARPLCDGRRKSPRRQSDVESKQSASPTRARPL